VLKLKVGELKQIAESGFKKFRLINLYRIWVFALTELKFKKFFEVTGMGNQKQKCQIRKYTKMPEHLTHKKFDYLVSSLNEDL